MIKITLKIALLIIIIQNVEAKNYYDTSPSRIIKNDVDLLKKFDEKLYKIAEKKHKKYSIGKIYRFIQKHRSLINDYSRLKISIVGELGSRTRRGLAGLGEDYTLNDELTNSREYYLVGLKAIYPIYDKKTEKTLRNERIKQENEIINKIALYLESKETIDLLKEELEIVRLIQIRDKALVKTGIKYLDERIKTIERIFKIKKSIRQSRAKKDKLKEILLTMTTRPKTLSKML